MEVLRDIDADIISLSGLSPGAVCPNEIVQLTCSVQTAALTWRIPTLSIEINFVAATPLNSIFSSGGFLATLTVKSADLTNSTLTFKSNLSLNGISVECQEAGVFPIYSKNTTLALIGICINLLHTVCYINAILIVLPSSPAPLNSSVFTVPP